MARITNRTCVYWQFEEIRRGIPKLNRPIGLKPSSHTPKLSQIEAGQSQPKNQSPVNHRASGQAMGITVSKDSIINPLHAELSDVNFHPLEVVFRYRDPQLQVAENYSYLSHLRPKIDNCYWLNIHLYHMIKKVSKTWINSRVQRLKGQYIISIPIATQVITQQTQNMCIV